MVILGNTMASSFSWSHHPAERNHHHKKLYLFFNVFTEVHCQKAPQANLNHFHEIKRFQLPPRKYFHKNDISQMNDIYEYKP